MYAWTTAISVPPRQTLASDRVPTPPTTGADRTTSDFRNPPRWTRSFTSPKPSSIRNGARPLWAEMQKIYAEQLPVLPLFFRADATFSPNG